VSRIAALTGGTGFVGRAVARRLVEDGWRLRMLARQPISHSQLDGIPFEPVIGDLTDQESLRRLVASADLVVHCAGLTKALGTQELFRVNATGSALIGEAVARFAPAARVILVSSLAAREPQLSPYAESKRAGETALVNALSADRCIIVRPTAVYGPWDLATLPVFQAAARGVAPVLNTGAARVSMIHVHDLAAAVGALGREGPAGGLYELDDGTAAGYSWRDIIAHVAAAVGRNTVSVRIPPSVLKTVAVMTETACRLRGKPSVLTVGKAREILHPDWTCRADRSPPPDLWRPRIKIDKGFADTVSWYRAMNWL
jgi:nucleoside-diphosphate-sugar epimerase